MKICIVGTGFTPIPPNGPGAVERLVFDVSSSIVNQGLAEIHVIDIISNNRERTNPKIIYHLVNTGLNDKSSHFFKGLLFGLLSPFELIKQHKKEKFDLIHVHNQYSGVTCLFAAKLLKIPVVYTSHNQELINESFFSSIRHFGSYLLIHLSDYITVQTPSVKKEYQEKFRLGSKLEQIYLGVDTHLNKSLNPARNTNLIICVARIVPRKRQEILVQAMPLVLKKNPKVRLMLIGPIDDKGYYAQLQNLITTNKLEKSVIFTGPISNSELYNYYRKASVFCLASDNEHQGLVVLEAMIFGTPVVVSDIGPFVDVVSMGKDVAIINQVGDYKGFAKSILKLLNSKSLRNKYGLNGFNFVNKQFSWDTIAKRTVQFYKRILK